MNEQFLDMSKNDTLFKLDLAFIQYNALSLICLLYFITFALIYFLMYKLTFLNQMQWILFRGFRLKGIPAYVLSTFSIFIPQKLHKIMYHFLSKTQECPTLCLSITCNSSNHSDVCCIVKKLKKKRSRIMNSLPRNCNPGNTFGNLKHSKSQINKKKKLWKNNHHMPPYSLSLCLKHPHQPPHY